MTLDAIHRRAVVAPTHFMHESWLALKQQQSEVAGATSRIRGIKLGLSSRSLFLGHFFQILGGNLRGLWRVLEIDNKQVAGNRMLHAAELTSDEFSNHQRQVDKVVMPVQVIG